MRHVPRPQQRLWLRMAARLQARLAARDDEFIRRLPEECWAECQRLAWMSEKARVRGYVHSCRALDGQLRSALSRLQRELDQALYREPPRLAPPPALRSLYEELTSLHQEFERVECKLRERTISVVTDSIELDDVHLGPFEIRLELNHRRDPAGYRVIALDPHPAASSEDTTHPHMRCERLCEGDGKLPIGRALEQGRLCDFFCIVVRILGTYNPGSAYIALEDWSGVPCVDCGDAVNEDDRSPCQACGGTLCGDCARTCSVCSDDYCSDCIAPCAGCSEGHCRACLSPCADCRERFCADCLFDRRCEACGAEPPEHGDAREERPAPLLPLTAS